MDTAEGKKLYGLRKETVEPVFGINGGKVLPLGRD
jgi:hypothetical protein